MSWQVDLENQGLIIQVEPSAVCIFEVATLEVPILGDEVVVTQGEHEPFIIVADEPIDRNNSNALPLLIQQRGVLVPTVVDAETVELGVEVKVDERAVGGWRNSGLQDAV